MKELLIKLRASLQETRDRLENEKMPTELKRNKRNLIVNYLEQASIEAGALLRDLDN